ncbi:MAG: hypothetical protein Q9227_001211 [Pyrenula ochraceoflavens]
MSEIPQSDLRTKIEDLGDRHKLADQLKKLEHGSQQCIDKLIRRKQGQEKEPWYEWIVLALRIFPSESSMGIGDVYVPKVDVFIGRKVKESPPSNRDQGDSRGSLATSSSSSQDLKRKFSDGYPSDCNVLGQSVPFRHSRFDIDRGTAEEQDLWPRELKIHKTKHFMKRRAQTLPTPFKISEDPDSQEPTSQVSEPGAASGDERDHFLRESDTIGNRLNQLRIESDTEQESSENGAADKYRIHTGLTLSGAFSQPDEKMDKNNHDGHGSGNGITTSPQLTSKDDYQFPKTPRENWKEYLAYVSDAIGRFNMDKPLPPLPDEAQPPFEPVPLNYQSYELFKAGNEASRKGDLQLAVEYYNSAIELEPRNAKYLSNRAAAFSSQGHHQTALRDAELAVRCDPSYAAAWNRLGYARYSTGNALGSIEAYEIGSDIQTCHKSLDSTNAISDDISRPLLKQSLEDKPLSPIYADIRKESPTWHLKRLCECSTTPSSPNFLPRRPHTSSIVQSEEKARTSSSCNRSTQRAITDKPPTQTKRATWSEPLPPSSPSSLTYVSENNTAKRSISETVTEQVLKHRNWGSTTQPPKSPGVEDRRIGELGSPFSHKGKNIESRIRQGSVSFGTCLSNETGRPDDRSNWSPPSLEATARSPPRRRKSFYREIKDRLRGANTDDGLVALRSTEKSFVVPPVPPLPSSEQFRKASKEAQEQCLNQ